MTQQSQQIDKNTIVEIGDVTGRKYLRFSASGFLLRSGSRTLEASNDDISYNHSTSAQEIWAEGLRKVFGARAGEMVSFGGGCIYVKAILRENSVEIVELTLDRKKGPAFDIPFEGLKDALEKLEAISKQFVADRAAQEAHDAAVSALEAIEEQVVQVERKLDKGEYADEVQRKRAELAEYEEAVERTRRELAEAEAEERTAQEKLKSLKGDLKAALEAAPKEVREEFQSSVRYYA